MEHGGKVLEGDVWANLAGQTKTVRYLTRTEPHQVLWTDGSDAFAREVLRDMYLYTRCVDTKSTQPEVGRAVLIEWKDIQSSAGWQALSEDCGVADCSTFGVLVRATDQHLTIAACIGRHEGVEDETNLRQSIPRGTIARWSYLDEKNYLQKEE